MEQVKRQITIIFDQYPIEEVLIDSICDSEIERALASIEERLGPLERDWRTGFPTFTVFRDGEEIGGG